MSTASNDIALAGRLFPDAAIDQIRGNQLVFWHEGQARLLSSAEYGGRAYKPAALSPSLEHVLHLPAGIADCGSLENLIGDLSEAVTCCDVGLDQYATLLVATSIMGTWVADCVPGPFVINFWGNVGAESTLLDFMQCVCRRALRLVEPTPRELAGLPTGFTPTLILTRPSERALARLVAAAGAHFLSRGEVIHVQSPMVLYTSQPLRGPAMSIPLPVATHAWRRITKPEAHGVVDRFQPRLLYYRLKHYPNVADSQFDVPEFCPEVRQVARVLGAVVEGSPSLQASIVTALRSLDEQRKAEQSQTPVAVVLESLLALCHSNTAVAHVGKVAELANTLLENRDEHIQLSPRLVGEMLRQQLGLVARRRALGYELAMDLDTQRRVHHLAVAHDVLQRVVDCPRCQEMVGAVNQSAPSL